MTKFKKGDKVMLRQLTYEEKKASPVTWLPMHDSLYGRVLTIKTKHPHNEYSFEESWLIVWGGHLEKIDEREFVLY